MVDPHCCPVLTDIASHESDNQLLSLGALAAWLGHRVLVEHLHRAFKAGKLHHGVRDLPHPQGNHTLVEPAGDMVVMPTAQLSCNPHTFRLLFFALVEKNVSVTR